MRIVFFGTPAVAVPALDALTASRHQVQLVVSQPDRRAGRSAGLRAPPVAKAALDRGIELLQAERVRSEEFAQRLASFAPAVLVVVAYGRILPKRLLELAPHGAINVHFSMLPAYRGAAPVQWALARGERRTGVTTMQMSEGLDEGDVLLQREVAVHEGEHAPSLASRLSRVGAELLTETLDELEKGAILPRPQEPSGVSYAPLLRPEDGSIDPAWSALEIEGRVRGFDPWPGAWVRVRGRRLRWVEARASEQSLGGVAGRVAGLVGDRLQVTCGSGTTLEVTQVQPEGRRVMSARDAVNGRVIAPGDLVVLSGVRSRDQAQDTGL